MIQPSAAERLLISLGVSEPKEIDVEAIAFHCGAFVKYRPHDGSEARLIGSGERAIISVNSQSRRERQRFSIGHELGHWTNDRGKAFACDKSTIGSEWAFRSDPESQANAFAADLLLPRFLFLPAMADRPLDFTTARDLGIEFETSLTATAIRLVRLGEMVPKNRTGG